MWTFCICCIDRFSSVSVALTEPSGFQQFPEGFHHHEGQFVVSQEHGPIGIDDGRMEMMESYRAQLASIRG